MSHALAAHEKGGSAVYGGKGYGYRRSTLTFEKYSS